MKNIAAVLFALSLVACGSDSANEDSPAADGFSISDAGVKTRSVEGFGGVMAESYADSQE